MCYVRPLGGQGLKLASGVPLPETPTGTTLGQLWGLKVPEGAMQFPQKMYPPRNRLHSPES